MKTYIKIEKSIITDRILELESRGYPELCSEYNMLQSILKQSEEIK